MENFDEYAYWLAFADPNLELFKSKNNIEKNNLISKIYDEYKITLKEFFDDTEENWKNSYKIKNEVDAKGRKIGIQALKETKANLAYFHSVLQKLQKLSPEIERAIIPIVDSRYPQRLKDQSKGSHPLILCTIGNAALLKEPSIAIVGSRDCKETSLNFTTKIAQKAVKNYQVVVSGGAKGIDTQAVDAALEANGQGIIVLAQGILTVSRSLIQKYYEHLRNGNLLLLSQFMPSAGWKSALAINRNSTIYALADDIYVSEVTINPDKPNSGGTWNGIKDGLAKGRTIKIRQADSSEPCDNNKIREKYLELYRKDCKDQIIYLDAEGEPIAPNPKPQSIGNVAQLDLF